MTKKVIDIIRWVVGIFLMLLIIGAISSGDTIAGIIVFIIGLLIIPRVSDYLINLLKGNKNIPFPGFFTPIKMKSIMKELDLHNDDNLIETIDAQLKNKKSRPHKSELKRMGKHIYQHIAAAGISSSFQKGESKKLQDIATYFHLSEQEIKNIGQVLKPQLLKKIEEIYRGFYKEISSEPKVNNLVETLQRQFGLPSEKIYDIKKKVKTELLQTFLTKKLNSLEITPNDETDISQELSKLGYSTDQLSGLINPQLYKELKRAKQMWRLSNGIFKPISPTDLNLNLSESCLWATSSKRLNVSVEDMGYSLNGGGVSFAVNNNISLAGGYGSATPIRKNVVNEYQGKLYLTNKRVIFLSPASDKSFQLNYSDLLSFKLYSDGIELLVDQNNFALQLDEDDLELFATALASAIKNNLDPDNEKYRLALAELETGSDII